MPVRVPTPDQLRAAAQKIGLSLTDSDVESFIGLLAPNIASYNIIDALPDNLPPVKYPRTPGYRPEGEENKYNAWYYKTSVNGAPDGKLKGKTVVLKDNIMLAGVPMMVGVSTLEGYIPEIDATVAVRVLDAGGEIVGKAHCESLCLSGGSHTNAAGPTHNPYRMGYTTGGSSSGCAALVALGEVDMAIGCAQGGSIRKPAAFCGVYGMKPTHGLVPYTGIMPLEIYLDHAGPITASVRDNALLLEVIAGPDGYDPRQYNPITQPYTEMLEGGVSAMKIAVVKEGFGHKNSEPEVDSKVRQAAETFKKMGATVSEVSIPWHLLGRALWLPIAVEGMTQTMMWGDGYGVSHPDLYVVSLMDFHRNWRHRANELSETTKLLLLLGTYINSCHGNRYYGKTMNIARKLRAAYDTVLADYDLLLMPTVPMKAMPLPPPDASREVIVERAFGMSANDSPFSLSHHPSMNVPCGMVDGLPVGMMLVGKHYDEPAIYKAALAFEQAIDWKSW